MVTYEIPGKKKHIINFLMAVDDDQFTLKLLKEDNVDYYTSDEAMKILAEALDEPYSADVLRVFAFPYFDKKQFGIMWLRIAKLDDYTLLVERFLSYDIEEVKKREKQSGNQIQLPVRY